MWMFATAKRAAFTSMTFKCAAKSKRMDLESHLLHIIRSCFRQWENHRREGGNKNEVIESFDIYSLGFDYSVFRSL